MAGKKNKPTETVQAQAQKISNARVKKKKRKISGNAQLIAIFIILGGVIFIPTTIVLCVGLLPTFAAFFADRSRKKIKPITVGAMNIAGCSPFLFEMWIQGHTIEKAMDIIMDPVAVVIMYMAAAVGYVLDSVVTSSVSGFLYQRGVARQEAIAKRLAELIERWGPEVSGDIPLDEFGFPLEKKKEGAEEEYKSKNESRR